MQKTNYQIKTPSATISLTDTKPNHTLDHPTIIFIHGHLCNKSFFSHQINSPLLQQYRLIALDLPGYGESSPPVNPQQTYSFPGFADTIAQLIQILNLQNIVIVGWSLGGHIALELTTRLKNLKGLLITGTPPIEISLDGLGKGFRIADPEILACFGKGNLTLHEAQLLATISGYDGTKEKQYLIDAIFQSDEGAKTIYPQSIAKGIGQNQPQIVKNWPQPIAIIAGQNDIAINTDYIINEVEFNNLWQEKVHIIKDTGHAVHIEKPQEFNTILAQFLQDIWP